MQFDLKKIYVTCLQMHKHIVKMRINQIKYWSVSR
jgi:hypothetical protein